MQTDKLYRFVKADDRTPKYSDVILRLHRTEIRKGGWVNGSFCDYDLSRGWYPLSVRTSDIEWLEEIEAPAASPVIEATTEEYDAIEDDAMKYMRAEARESGGWGEVKKAYMAGAQDQFDKVKEWQRYGKTIVEENKKLRNEVSALDDKLEMLNRPSPVIEGEEKSPEERAEELFDKYSEHIEDNIDSFSMVAGSSVVTREQFKKCVIEILSK